MSAVQVPLLELIPSRTLYNPWTLVTSTFIDTNFFKFLISIVGLYLGLNFINRSWDNSNIKFDNSFIHNEINRYIFFCVVITNFITVLNYITFNIITLRFLDLDTTIDNGVFSILMSFIVVLKQLKPEFEIKFIKLRLKYLPFTILLFALFWSLCSTSLWPFLPVSNNFLVSWYYLRFVQKDYSQIFEFVSFFPEFTTPLVSTLVRPLTLLAIFLKLAPSQTTDKILPTTTIDVLERRRQVALKVLEQSIDTTENLS